MLSFVQALSRGAPGYLLSHEQVVPIRGTSRIDASSTALLPRQSNSRRFLVLDEHSMDEPSIMSPNSGIDTFRWAPRTGPSRAEVTSSLRRSSYGSRLCQLVIDPACTHRCRSVFASSDNRLGQSRDRSSPIQVPARLHAPPIMPIAF